MSEVYKLRQTNAELSDELAEQAGGLDQKEKEMQEMRAKHSKELGALHQTNMQRIGILKKQVKDQEIAHLKLKGFYDELSADYKQKKAECTSALERQAGLEEGHKKLLSDSKTAVSACCYRPLSISPIYRMQV